MNYEIRTRIADMPTTIRGFTVPELDGSYMIVLNSRLNDEMRLKAYLHELEHIAKGDYEKSCSADLIEFFAHGGE